MSSKNGEVFGTRERIMSAAARLLEGGSVGVRMSDVAREAGVSRQAVYLHFGSRAELMVETARHWDSIKGIEGRISGYRAAYSGRERLAAFVDFWGNYLVDIHGIAHALMVDRETDEAVRAAWNDRMKDIHDACRDIAGRLERDGDLAEGWKVDEAGDLLWATLSVANWEGLKKDRGWSVEQYVENITKMCENAFVRGG